MPLPDARADTDTDSDADTESANADHELLVAIREQDVDRVVALLHDGADPNYIEYGYVYSVLSIALWQQANAVRIATALLDAGADPNRYEGDEYNWAPPIHFTGRRDLIELLLKAGADPNARMHSTDPELCGITPLMGASPANRQLLLDYGADATLIAKDGRSVRDWWRLRDTHTADALCRDICKVTI